MAKIHTGGATGSAASSTGPFFGPAASRALWAVGLIYLVGSAVDLGVLWLGQRQPGLQWEFVAVTNTVEAWPRFILAIALIYVAAFVGGSQSVGLYRVLALCLLVLGIGALGLGGLATLNYLSVSEGLTGGSGGLVKSAVVKTLTLCVLYVVLLIPFGILGLKGGRTSA